MECGGVKFVAVVYKNHHNFTVHLQLPVVAVVKAQLVYYLPRSVRMLGSVQYTMSKRESSTLIFGHCILQVSTSKCCVVNYKNYTLSVSAKCTCTDYNNDSQTLHT